jgi:hypothetical protein
MSPNVLSRGVASGFVFRITVFAAMFVFSNGNISLAAIFPTGPFSGVLKEGWESFHSGFVTSPLTIMSGQATCSATNLAIYEPLHVGFGLGTSGDAQAAEGVKGAGACTDTSLTTIKFNVPVNAFGGYFGAATHVGRDPSRIRFEFYGGANQSLGTSWMDYSRSAQFDGLLLWSGATSTEPIYSVVISGYFVVNDSLQANPVPEPSTIALLLIATIGSVFLWRRRS